MSDASDIMARMLAMIGESKETLRKREDVQLSDKILDIIEESKASPAVAYDALGIVILDILKRSHVPGDHTRREVIDSWINQLQKGADVLDILFSLTKK